MHFAEVSMVGGDIGERPAMTRTIDGIIVIMTVLLVIGYAALFFKYRNVPAGDIPFIVRVLIAGFVQK